MLTDLIEPIIAAIQRHVARLQAINKMNAQPGGALPPGDDLREESANLAEKEIQSIVQPEYQRIADSQPDIDHKISAVADAQRDLMKLTPPQVQAVDPQLGGGLEEIVMKGALAAARAVYATIVQDLPTEHTNILGRILTTSRGLAGIPAGKRSGGARTAKSSSSSKRKVK
jgi:hypothetical protein